MQEFLAREINVKNYIINRVDTNFPEKYFYFLRTNKELANNTAVKYITFVKTIFNPVIQDHILKANAFRGLRLKLKPVQRQFLTLGEIESITQDGHED